MVFFNYSTMQMAAKIVYYGPGLCGKTTNLHYIYTKTSPQSRGEMVSLETETDRTLFFDLLPIDVGVIGGFKTRLQLYTVPGQVFYNTTRKLVLKGVDGIVFVADSQRAMLEANTESFKNLSENLGEIGLSLDDLPLVIQLNKRDLPNVAEPDAILSHLDPTREFEHIEAVAATGTGVFETLKLISKLTLRTLRRRMTGEEPVRASSPRREQVIVRTRDPQAPATSHPRSGPASSPTIEAPVQKTDDSPTIAVPSKSEPQPSPTIEAAMPQSVEFETVISSRAGVARDLETSSESPTTMEASEPVPAATAPEIETDTNPAIASPEMRTAEAPEASVSEVAASHPESSAPPVESPSPAPVPEPDIDFNQSEKPTRKADVKTVKVRSSVDIMAELESLRKRATQSTPKPKDRSAAATATSPAGATDLKRTIAMEATAPDVSRARTVRIAVSFEEGGEVLVTREQSLEVSDLSGVRSLSVDLKIALE